jgi:hypothetical protein
MQDFVVLRKEWRKFGLVAAYLFVFYLVMHFVFHAKVPVSPEIGNVAAIWHHTSSGGQGLVSRETVDVAAGILAREPTQSHEQPRGGGVHEKEGKAAQGKSCQNQTGSARFGAREIGRASQFAIPRVTAQLPAFH